MKKNIFSIIALLLIGSFSILVNAQDDISNIFKAGVVDLNTLAKGYLTPAGNGFAAGLGTNWYSTAEVHKVFGFDLTIGAGVAQSPQSEQMFSLEGLTNLKPTDPSITQAPSFTGKGNGVELNLMQPQYLSDGTTPNPLWNNGTGRITHFSTPKGESKYVPTASVQFTIGLPFINDLSIRFIPTVKADGVETSMWGIGIKHNIKQWIPVVKDLPFDAAVVLAYSKFQIKYSFPTSAQITPDDLVSDGVTYQPDPVSNDYTTQGMKVSASAETANIVFSKKLVFITPYVGFGVTKTDFNLDVTGNYPTLGDPLMVVESNGVAVPELNSNGKPIMQVKNIANPVSFGSSETMTNMTLGLRMKLLIFTLHAQYAFQKYPVASAGFGLTFR